MSAHIREKHTHISTITIFNVSDINTDFYIGWKIFADCYQYQLLMGDYCCTAQFVTCHFNRKIIFSTVEHLTMNKTKYAIGICPERNINRQCSKFQFCTFPRNIRRKLWKGSHLRMYYWDESNDKTCVKFGADANSHKRSQTPGIFYCESDDKIRR